MAIKKDGVIIGTVSGGIVNFDGTAIIAPISKSNTINGAGANNSGFIVITNSR
ncbi:MULTISPECIES: spore germination protein [Bacillus]|uniref:Spore germination protein n=1 Tax=Bacillus xiapuensis TaxID=2014075 RepID=A0ABU6NCQ7_9BACI|nr:MULTISPECIES: spore germination protein [Bacillus]MED3564013.1 spore germination protein [Bacillus xiapuensis]